MTKITTALLFVLLLIGGITMLWFRKSKPTMTFRTVDLPGNIGSVSIPADFVAEMEDDATLLAYRRGRGALSLRFSSLSLVKKGGGEDGGRAYIRDKAMAEGLEYQEVDEKGVLTFEQEIEENGMPLILRLWEVGIRNTVVIIATTILKEKRNDALVRSTLSEMPGILRSIQVTQTHQIVGSGGRKIETVTETTDRTPCTIVPFGMHEETWLASNLARAQGLGLKYGSGAELAPAELDRIFSRWMHEEGEKEAGELMANALGAAFGTWLVDRHGFSWVVLTDESGTEYVVRHTRGNDGIPQNLRAETDWEETAGVLPGSLSGHTRSTETF